MSESLPAGPGSPGPGSLAPGSLAPGIQDSPTPLTLTGRNPSFPRAFPSSSVWRMVTVKEVEHPTSRSVILRLDVPDRVDHLPGQHYVIRLRAEDGYTASRSYSLASAPSSPLVELYIDRLPDGEVSTYLADVVEPGDTLEVRGPIGGWFVWNADQPALALGGGSGVVPLVSMLRQARELGRPELLNVAVAARTLADLPYAQELIDAGALIALSREPYRLRPPGRITDEDLFPLLEGQRLAFVCGSSPFAEAVSRKLVGLGLPIEGIKVERFGPTGS